MQEDDRVDILSIRRIWVDTALKIFSIEVIVYTIFLIRYAAAKVRPLMETAQVVVIQLAAFMAVAAGFTIILFQGVDFLCFFHKFIKSDFKTRLRKQEPRALLKEKLKEKLKNGICG